LETSAKNATNVETAFLKIAAQIKSRMKAQPVNSGASKGTKLTPGSAVKLSDVVLSHSVRDVIVAFQYRCRATKEAGAANNVVQDQSKFGAKGPSYCNSFAGVYLCLFFLTKFCVGMNNNNDK
jgi:hypothetical protein